MSATCGLGYSPEPGSSNSSSPSDILNTSTIGGCTACALGFHKEALDNSPCVACPKRATTNSSGTTGPQWCICNDGYTASNDSALDETTLVCVIKGQYVSEEDAKVAAEAVSTAVGVIVGANVAVAVGTAVASSVSTAVAASSGGAVGGVVTGSGGAATGEVAGSGSSGSSGGTLTLITQVQFLNQVGKIGERQICVRICVICV